MRDTRAWAIAIGACWVGIVATTAAQSARGRRDDLPLRQRPPQILTDSLAGRDSFQLYCAPCHGETGKGDGPVASALKARPADVTQLARKNGGLYPAEQVSAFVTGTGRTLPSHGPAEMPVWGPTFRAFESDARVRERIKNLVAFVGSLQPSTSAPGTAGAQLFRQHCASCHGATGEGNGLAADRLRQRPPDLTRYTGRNGGVFPSERVRRIVDGRDVPSHGEREMPVWGNAFRTSREGLTADDVRRRIDAIVSFLEAIQRRDA